MEEEFDGGPRIKTAEDRLRADARQAINEIIGFDGAGGGNGARHGLKNDIALLFHGAEARARMHAVMARDGVEQPVIIDPSSVVSMLERHGYLDLVINRCNGQPRALMYAMEYMLDYYRPDGIDFTPYDLGSISGPIMAFSSGQRHINPELPQWMDAFDYIRRRWEIQDREGVGARYCPEAQMAEPLEMIDAEVRRTFEQDVNLMLHKATMRFAKDSGYGFRFFLRPLTHPYLHHSPDDHGGEELPRSHEGRASGIMTQSTLDRAMHVLVSVLSPDLAEAYHRYYPERYRELFGRALHGVELSLDGKRPYDPKSAVDRELLRRAQNIAPSDAAPEREM